MSCVYSNLVVLRGHANNRIDKTIAPRVGVGIGVDNKDIIDILGVCITASKKTSLRQ